MERPIGAMTALITPFKNGQLDEAAYERLIQRQIRHGIDAVVPVGTTGESATLTHEEHRRCIEIAVATCRESGTKVVAGAGSNSTAEAIGLAQFAEKSGADAILSVTPYYNKPSQEGLYQHYKALAESVNIPLILYHVPGRTGVGIKTNTAIRLMDDIENIYAIKEASGSIDRVVEMNARRPDLAIISGEDAINYPILACGGQGVISVTANLLPDQISQMVHAAMEGRHDESRTINNHLYAINKALFVESNPIPIKAAMYRAGLLDTLEYRLPLVAPSEDNMQVIESTLSGYEVVQ